MAAATESMEKKTVKTGNLIFSHWSSFRPAKIPNAMIANIWKARPE